MGGNLLHHRTARAGRCFSSSCPSVLRIRAPSRDVELNWLRVASGSASAIQQAYLATWERALYDVGAPAGVNFNRPCHFSFGSSTAAALRGRHGGTCSDSGRIADVCQIVAVVEGQPRQRAAGAPQTVCPSLKRRLTLDVTARVTRIGRAEPQTRRASRGP
jgi:hypothetical protein